MGRPAFQPTEQQKSLVIDLASAGYSLNQIARELGISRPTVSKSFPSELSLLTTDSKARSRTSRRGSNSADGVASETSAEKSDMSAREFLEKIVNDPTAQDARRLRAAEVLLRFGHLDPETGRVPGKREMQAQRASEAANRFKPSAAPISIRKDEK